MKVQSSADISGEAEDIASAKAQRVPGLDDDQGGWNKEKTAV